jgi:hypothetical protein
MFFGGLLLAFSVIGQSAEQLIQVPIKQDFIYSSNIFKRNFYGGVEEDILRVKLFDCSQKSICSQDGLVIRKNGSESLQLCSNIDFICFYGALNFSYPRKLQSKRWSHNGYEYFLVKSDFELELINQKVVVDIVVTKKSEEGYVNQFLYSRAKGVVAISELKVDEQNEVYYSATYFLKKLPGLGAK